MILTSEQIIEKISQPEAGSDIVKGDRIQKEHRVHVTGEGYSDVLHDVIGKTRTLEYGNRELKEPITKFLTKKIKDELSRWKNATGTRKTYDFGDNKELVIEFRKLLTRVWKNGSITKFAHFINDAIYTDFNGFAIAERGKVDGNVEYRDGIPYKSEGGMPYIIFKSLADVADFKQTGRKVEYIILHYGYKTMVFDGKEEKVPLYRVIDDSFDYVFAKTQNGVIEVDERIPNSLGYVPAVQISDILNDPLNDNVKTSPIYQTLPLLQDYMTRHAEHVISELIHASPILALMGQKCDYETDDGQKCERGEIFIEGKFQKCPKCNGKGATVPGSSSEVIVIPQTDKNGNTFDPKNIGQYITPPTEVLKHQSDELDKLENTIVYSGTGIKTMIKTSIQTATEIVLNLKPLEDKISSILDNIEYVEQFITDCIGKMWNEKYNGSEIHYPRKLNIRDENLILSEIEQSKRAGMPVSQIRLLVQELIVTRYQNSKEDLERALMLLELEPAAVFSINEVQASPYYTDDEKKFKMNFDDYIDRFELEHGQINLYKAGSKMEDRLKNIREILMKYNDEKSITYRTEGSGDDRDREGIQ